MCAIDHAATNVQWGAVPGTHAERMDTGARAYDIDDGIHCSYFVEVNLLDVDIMNLCLASAEQFEGVNRSLLDGIGQLRGFNQFADGRERAPMGVLVTVVFLPMRVSVLILMRVGMLVLVRVTRSITFV
jgi:hypothetical protein